jgi:hypothetical protein
MSNVKEHIKTTTIIDSSIKQQLQQETLGQVVVHCSFTATDGVTYIRIWESTKLLDANSNHVSTLLHVENMVMAPDWLVVPPLATCRFTLVFSGLPKTCRQFTFFEDITEPGGFYIPNISRNTTDVYELTLA